MAALLGLADVELVARQRALVKLGANAQARLGASRQALHDAMAAREALGAAGPLGADLTGSQRKGWR
jgi:hypothetical protein